MSPFEQRERIKEERRASQCARCDTQGGKHQPNCLELTLRRVEIIVLTAKLERA